MKFFIVGVLSAILTFSMSGFTHADQVNQQKKYCYIVESDAYRISDYTVFWGAHEVETFSSWTNNLGEGLRKARLLKTKLLMEGKCLEGNDVSLRLKKRYSPVSLRTTPNPTTILDEVPAEYLK